MHNAAFARLGLPHSYSLCETTDPEEAVRVLRDAPCGGGSVTTPLKVAIVPFLDSLSPAARAIGAVNTVVVERDSGSGQIHLRGDNTDWLGILLPLGRLLRSRGSRPGGDARDAPTALLLGAGGAAAAASYALAQMQAHLIVWNRTLDKAEAVAREYRGPSARAVSILDPGTLPPTLDIIISMIPADAYDTCPVPDGVLTPHTVVLDGAYIRAQGAAVHTPLTLHAASRGATLVATGLDMLVEQGTWQFQLWTGRPAPRAVMSAAARNMAV